MGALSIDEITCSYSLSTSVGGGNSGGAGATAGAGALAGGCCERTFQEQVVNKVKATMRDRQFNRKMRISGYYVRQVIAGP